MSSILSAPATTRNQREDLRPSIGAFVGGNGGMTIREFGQVRLLGQRRCRYQPRGAD